MGKEQICGDQTTYMWRPNNMLLQNEQVNEEIGNTSRHMKIETKRP